MTKWSLSRPSLVAQIWSFILTYHSFTQNCPKHQFFQISWWHLTKIATVLKRSEWVNVLVKPSQLRLGGPVLQSDVGNIGKWCNFSNHSTKKGSPMMNLFWWKRVHLPHSRRWAICPQSTVLTTFDSWEDGNNAYLSFCPKWTFSWRISFRRQIVHEIITAHNYCINIST